jgi:hypothetical protein
MNSVLLCDTTEIRPEALSDLWVQDRNPFFGADQPSLRDWTRLSSFSRHFVPERLGQKASMSLPGAFWGVRDWRIDATIDRFSADYETTD